MITSRKNFDFKGKCILEKLSIKKSSKLRIDFPNEACYLYVREGHLVMNDVDQSTPLSSNEGIVLNCGYYVADFVTTSPYSVTEVLAIHLYPEVLRTIFKDDLPEFFSVHENHVDLRKTVSDSMLTKFIESLEFYFENPRIVTEDILILKVRELILLLVQSTHAESIHKLFSTLFTRKATTISEVVNTHLYGNYSLSELAKFAGVSLTSFKNEFAAIFGEPPARYIRRKKIERAKELLTISTFSISEIADQLGFKDVSHFSKSFHSICGTSPKAFRKHQISPINSSKIDTP